MAERQTATGGRCRTALFRKETEITPLSITLRAKITQKKHPNGCFFQQNPYWMGVTVMVWMWGRCSTMIRPFLSMGVASVQILSTMSMPSVT